MEPFGVFVLFIVIAVFVRLTLGSLDGERVEEYVRNKGWKLVDKVGILLDRAGLGKRIPASIKSCMKTNMETPTKPTSKHPG